MGTKSLDEALQINCIKCGSMPQYVAMVNNQWIECSICCNDTISYSKTKAGTRAMIETWLEKNRREQE